jgi:hypothetical protein
MDVERAARQTVINPAAQPRRAPVSPSGGSIKEKVMPARPSGNALFPVSALRRYMRRITWARGPTGFAKLGKVR